jgi:YceI-like domain
MSAQGRCLSLLLTATLTGIVSGSSRSAAAETRSIDTARSTLTVLVYKSGLFSGFADDHIIDAPIAGGTISDSAPLAVTIEVRAADLRVRDPNLSASKREQVQQRMVGAEVLDVQKYPSIAFASTAVEPNGPDKLTVTGRLTIHGLTRPVTVAVVRANGRYRGTVALKQRDFGITPISIAGGTVKVKDELKIEFDIVAQ